MKKALSVLLCMVLLLGTVAIGGDGFVEVLDVLSMKTYAASSGTCGDNLTWTLDDNGTLTIAGTGAMSHYDSYKYEAPWYNERSIVKKVFIGNSVTSIGSYAFHRCFGFTSITIPDSVKSIGNNAFDGCTGLTSITIPDSVTSIGYDAFINCAGLTSIVVSSGNTVYHSTGNCLINGKTLVAGTKNSSIPNDGSVTYIGNSAFAGCTGLTSITIPDSVTSIGDYAFYCCFGLTSVTIGNSVKYIDRCAFDGCIGLTSITIPDSVTSIGSEAFLGCTGLTSITIPDSVTSIGDVAFDGCTGLTSITIPDSVTSINSYAFSGCTGLTSITIPDSVTSIGYFAFSGCTGLTSITIPDSITSINSYAFSGCTGLTDVYYAGSESDWNNISIESHNSELLNAIIHFNSDLGETDSVSQTIVVPKSPDSGSGRYEIIDIPYYCSYTINNKASVEWSENLFNKSSTYYEKRLDVLGAALSAAAEGKDSNDGSYISNAFLQLGFNKSDIFLYSYPNSVFNRSDATDSNGDKFANDDMYAFSIAGKRIGDSYLIMIVARGSTAAGDYIADVNGNSNHKVNGLSVYDRDYAFMADITNGISDFFGQHSNIPTNNIKIFITGHSLGGSAANLIAAFLNKNSIGTKDNIYCYTYGALSPLIGNQAESGYENIFNTFNTKDTYGPNGTGYPVGIKPAGWKDYTKKFGHILEFTYDYGNVYFKYKKDIFGIAKDEKEPLSDTINHDMTGYRHAVACDFSDGKQYMSICCPVDIEFRNNGQVVGRIKNNIIDENVTKIPCGVIGDAKFFIFDKDDCYDVVLIGNNTGTMDIYCGNTAVKGAEKDFHNITLINGKTFTLDIAENESINDYTLYVVDSSNNKTAEVNQDGSETQIKLSFWQRLIQWFRNLFAKLFKR